MLFRTRSNLFKRDSRRSDLGFLKSRSGQSLFNGLLLNDLNPHLADVGERLLLLCLNMSIHLLIEFGRNLYKKKKKSKDRNVDKFSPDELTFFLPSYGLENEMRRLGT